MDQNTMRSYIEILKEELVPALGCTEPIAIAYAAAYAREILGEFPDEIIVQCSGNIVKNVKGVVVPMTKNMRGIKAAAILGAVGGDRTRGLEVLSSVTPEDVEKTRELVAGDLCKEELLGSCHCLHLVVQMKKGEASSWIEIAHSHMNVVKILKNGEALTEVEVEAEEDAPKPNRDLLNIADILKFANEVDTDLVKEILEKQIAYNTAISEEGLQGRYGANVGRTLLQGFGEEVDVRAKARAAAGSDARMSGCEMPVVINSGSGNQGMTVSLPVIEYAKELCVTRERLYRALCVSNLVAIHQKTKIGKLSAYCGAVSAAAGAGAGINYLFGGKLAEISLTITNTLANVSGIICDGAKPSCAAKIASSIGAAIMGHTMAMQGKSFGAGEGLVEDNIEKTLENIGNMARHGMRETDEVILKLMTAQ